MRNNALFSVETRHLRVSNLECCRYLSPEPRRGLEIGRSLSPPPSTHQPPLKTAPPGRHRGVTHPRENKKNEDAARDQSLASLLFGNLFTQRSCNRGNGM
ncbi:hypothetical protein CEXT_301821 [Caerostris extrusa]|uniref:Uncharacterized protein n=1 Tax=Caerostris extrusa TaxID=172846 RepID=A0AAV4XAP7_CAEEX|nr:hypothetical protein CEXT_301821 [Caerostris extrusa]